MFTPNPTSSGEYMNTVISQWLDTYRAAGKATSTIRNRASYVHMMAKETNPLTITPQELQHYLASRDLSPEGRKSMVVALRSFYRWAYRRQLTAIDLSLELPSVTVPMGTPKPIPAVILARARAVADPETLLMLDLGALAGLRLHEIAAVHSDNISDFGLRVKGKGGRVRTVPIHPRLKERLAAVDGWAFPSSRRTGAHSSPDYVASRIEAVIEPPYTTHSLRHYFATSVYRGTHDLRSVQTLLGHASIETTQRYVLVDQDALNAAVLSVA
ncbi:XerD Site-specific recombinase XerD [uncultured Caudovirales phage]|uniref:Integrase n=1 Tax=uncultured Caudovirales phage TaxID=2100421 RepID=A0A6J7WQ52_9CAUD|nr:XerD Site-specific recombinase XerD [uncultured Caudovirales phage]